MRPQTWRTRTDLVVWPVNVAGHQSQRTRNGYFHGHVTTPSGFVIVYSLSSAVNPDTDRTRPGGWGPTTRLHFIWRDREYVKSYNTYNKALSWVGAVRQAGRFARDVAAGRVR